MGTLTKLFSKFTNKFFSKPKTKEIRPKTEYKPLRAINFSSLEKKHTLHKYHFGNFTPVKKVK